MPAVLTEPMERTPMPYLPARVMPDGLTMLATACGSEVRPEAELGGQFGPERSQLIGGDVVEVAPPYDPSGITALAGATMMYEILCLLAEAVAARP